MTALITIGMYFALIFGVSLFFGVPKMIQDFLIPKKVNSNQYDNIESEETNEPIAMGKLDEPKTIEFEDNDEIVLPNEIYDYGDTQQGEIEI